MRARVPFALILGLSILIGVLTGAHPAVADPRTVALLPSQGTADPAAAPAPTSSAVAPATPAVSAPEATPTASEPNPAPGPPAARKPLYRRWWLWTIVGGVIAQVAVTGAIVGTPARDLFVPTIPPQNPAPSSLVRF
jgi:hypothetical protein